ncbi:hypothetical protein Tco_0868241 [Tanacetum coccineum]
MQYCYAYSRSLLPELLKDGWTDSPLGPSTPGKSSRKPFSKGVVHRLILQNGLKTSTTLNRKATKRYTRPENVPGMTPAQAMTAIQKMAYHSQKWHDGSSSGNKKSSNNPKEIAVIISKLDKLGRDMRKLKENVHAIQVGCQICGRAHLDKECPLCEEVKGIEESKYGEYGRPFSNNNRYNE